MFSLPTLVPSAATAATAATAGAKAGNWEYKERNGYYSWQRNTVENSRDFTKFNHKPTESMDISEFLNSEIIENLNSEISKNTLEKAHAWTLQEVKYLLELVREYDERFYIIQDRFTFSDQERSLQDIKEMYFMVKKKYLKEKSKEYFFKYDKMKDVERRRNLEKLWNRTEKEIKDEEILVKEGKRRLYYQENWLNQAQELYFKLKDCRVEAPPIPPSTLTSLLDKPLKKRKESSQNLSQEFKGDFKRKRVSLTPVEDKAISEDLLSKKIQNTYLRSTKMLPVKSGLQAKVNMLLEEYGVLVKPKMATEGVIKKYDDLREKAKDILEMKKQLEKIEHDLKVVKVRKGELPEEQLDPEFSGSVGKKGLKKRSHSPKTSGSRQMKKSRN